MTITRAGLAGGTPADSATSVARSVGSVTAGQMVVFVVAVLNLSGSDDTFAAGDLTKTAGTSTIDTPQLDGQWGGQIGGGPEWLRVGIYSCLVTGSGTLTLTHAGAPSGSYLWAATEAYSGSWDSSRFEDSAGNFDATNNASSASTGNMDSAGGALFVGVLSVNNGAGVTFTPDGAWTSQAEETSSSHVMGSFIDRIVTGATTDSADWTFTTLDGGGYAGTAFGGVVYKESGPAATVDQAEAQFGADDGAENVHTWLAAQGADLTRALGSSFLYRALLQWTGDGAAITPVLRAQKNGSGGYVALPVGASVTPTLSYGAAGAFAYSGTNPAAAYPTGITTDSELVLFVGQKPSSANGGTVTTPTGWTLRGSLTGANDGDTGGYSTTLAADTGNCNIYVYTKDTVSGSESGSLTVTTGTNNVAWARIIRLQKSIPGTVTWAVGTGKDTSAGSVSIATTSMDIAAGDYILAGMVIPTDVTTPSQFSAHALSQSGTTFGTVTEIGEADSTTGNDIGGYLIEAQVSSGSGSGAVTMTATAGGTTTNVRGPGIVLRARPVTVNNELYVAPSSNITAGGESTTSRLSGGTGTFLTGRRWDDENGSDALSDPSADQNTEVEWSLNTQSPATDGDYWDFRVYNGSSALDTYTDEIRLTIVTASSPSLPLPQSLLQRMPALLRF